jgi:hypothetical protein
MRTTSLALALILQSVGAACIAEDLNTTVRRPIPEEHMAFLAEIKSAFDKYPEASASYSFVGIGFPTDVKPRTCVETCEVDWQHFWVDCRCEPPR